MVVYTTNNLYEKEFFNRMLITESNMNLYKYAKLTNFGIYWIAHNSMNPLNTHNLSSPEIENLMKTANIPYNRFILQPCKYFKYKHRQVV